MRLKPGFKRPGEDIDARVKEQIDKMRVDFDARVKAEVDEIVKNVLREKEDLTKREKADKIAKAIDAAKAVKATEFGPTDPGRKPVGAPSISVEDGGISCPTCHDGHIHKLETDKLGLVYKCRGDKCGLEYVMTPKNSDYKCVGCGAPVKKPAEEDKVKDMTCPFCNGPRAIKHDWSKLWNVKR